ncbi:MAG: hypothetical protein R3274_12815 [Desulfobacterales bacterium]|nr:hypothetical protein [Desulfobacterales bacterium]
MPNQWKEIGWYGLRFKIPADWQLGQIGMRYLSIDDEAGPVMEIKWAPVKGRFSHSVHLKRLTALQNRHLRNSVKTEPLSSEWGAVLSHFKASEFSWQSASKSGRGVLLYCPTCRNATLVQFFLRGPIRHQSVSNDILKSIHDHRSDGLHLWAAYDIRALMPATYELKNYRFEAGQYELDFAEGSQHVVLYRWSMASVLLDKKDLVQFARTVASFNRSEPAAGTVDGHDMVEWSTSPASGWQQRLSRFKRKASYCWLGIWHLKAKNRILGVRAEGIRPLNTEVLDHICRNYEII